MGNESSLVGKTLDHYEILEPLGRGGMADVYLADDTRHRRRVAVKVLRPEATASLGVERFLGEIEITANLQHPHILQLYDSGELDGTPYYVMPHVEGESLRQRLRRGPMPVDEALEIARQVGAALQYAHEHGVVHRDLKPENIMLQAGQALVADFGIALALSDDERTRLTAVGVSIGTPAYMSPEQAAGEYEVGAPADVYALGVVLYEMLTGEPPFVGKTAHTILTKVLTETPSPVHARRPEVPLRVSRAITEALAEEASERPASAGELVAELEVESTAPGAERMSTRARVAIGVLVAAAVVVGALAAMHWRGEVEDREWVRLEAIPRIQQLLNEAETVEAFQLATRAQQLLPDDPTIARLLSATSYEISIDSDPVGALVSYRPYDAGEWVTLGTTRWKLSGFRLASSSYASSTRGRWPTLVASYPSRAFR